MTRLTAERPAGLQQAIELMAGLRACADRAAAASCGLGAVEGALRSALPAAARIRRLVLHLRPERGYTGLYLREAGAAEARLATPSDDAASSATAWLWIAQTERSVLLDVEADTVSHPDGARPEGADAGPRWVGLTSAALRRRRSTHTLSIPLRPPRGKPIGMIVCEVDWPEAVGAQRPAWGGSEPGIQLLADLLSPFLLQLPSGPDQPVEVDPLLPVVGRAMAGVVRTLSAFSRFDETLLLRGATGTGKSHLAAWCHARSARARGPFIVADLRSGADGLGDAALFGWKRGAFTGAVADSRGAVAQAEGGTLFIDEIDKLDLTAQGRLLRLLEERRYRAIGEERERTADVRFIVGTNADLEGAVSQGRFLRDLYYRVNVLPIEVPSLSGRRDEIRPWARRMLRIAGESGAVLSAAFNDAAEDLLEAQPWPGNLRHLHSVVVRALAFCLADTTDPAQADAPPCEVSERHVRRALSLDRSEPPGVEGSVKDALGTVSRAFVTEAQRRRRAQEPSLDLDLTEGLRGLVLQAARERIGETREAFSLFGLDQQLRGGNYLRTWRREVERSDELLAALGISRSAPSERGD